MTISVVGWIVGNLSGQPLSESNGINCEPMVLVVQGAHADRGDTLFLSPDGLVGLCTQTGIGQREETLYSIDGATPTHYNEPFAIAETGTHLLSYWIEGGQRMERIVSIDETGPTIDFEWRYNSVRLGRWENVDRFPQEEFEKEIVCPRGCTFSMSSVDKLSGPKLLSYSLNQAPFERYVGPVRLMAKGKLILKVRAEDQAGNITQLEFNNFIIK